MACKAVAEAVRIIQNECLTDRADAMGQELLERLRNELSSSRTVGEVRGLGLAVGIEILGNRKTRTPASKDALRALFLEVLEEHVLVMTGVSSLRLYPPLTVTQEEVQLAVERITRAFRRWEESNT